MITFAEINNRFLLRQITKLKKRIQRRFEINYEVFFHRVSISRHRIKGDNINRLRMQSSVDELCI